MVKIPVIIEEILKKRNIRDYKKFLFPSLDDLIEPEEICGIKKATEEILECLKKKKKIFIYGDGDIDGIGGVFLLIKFFKEKNIEFDYYLTHRLEDYEIEENLVEFLLKNNYSFLILVDCGISSIKFLRKCAEKNIKVIVIDHHKADIEILPKNHIYIHPEFCDKKIELSASGLSFKLFQNLIYYFPASFVDYISIAGLSVLSENVSVLNDNRIFIREMIRDLKNSKVKGLNYMVSKYLNLKKISDEEIRSKINPKFNSPGRFGKPEITLNLLLEEDEEEIEKLIKEIDEIDRKRYKILQKFTKDIENRKGFEERFIVFENIPESLCGIIASRCVEKYKLPFLVMRKKGEVYKGSGRASYDFDLYNFLKPIKKYFISFGGHENAVGFKFKEENFEEIMNYWKGLKICDIEERKIDYDAIFEIDNLKPEIFKYIELLKPFGKDNNPPIFLSTNVTIKEIKKGEEKKYWAKKGNAIFECEIIDNFNYDDIVNKTIFYTPTIEEKEGYFKISLQIHKIL